MGNDEFDFDADEADEDEDEDCEASTYGSGDSLGDKIGDGICDCVMGVTNIITAPIEWLTWKLM